MQARHFRLSTIFGVIGLIIWLASDAAATPQPKITASLNNNFSLALAPNGSLWAWGYNNLGQLGLGDNTERHSPNRVGGDLDWAAVSAGSSHPLALKADGSLWAWGQDAYGQLGLGNDTSNRPTPTRVGTDSDWAAISEGG
jgi:alpha-tubulin suppressor-like RCC1 family protein